jgi:beta-glucosidase
MHRALLSAFAAILLCCPIAVSAQDGPSATNGPDLWRDPTQPIEARVKDLVGRMTLEEKALQMRNGAPGIARIGLPAYNYWNECLHGVARAGGATVFPQAIGMAATWDPLLLHDIADVIATEARAKNNDYTARHHGDSAQYFGLTFWTPNINIFRDPRWGRGQETYGEDPFLTSRLAVSFIRGLQGDDPHYVKAMACAKHFAVHSGPEPLRHTFDAEPSERDFYETYLPHFEAAVREGHVGAVMGAYNSVFGLPCCAQPLLLTDLLRNQWGFNGHVVSDCAAIRDIYLNHKLVPTVAEASARAVKAGCDLCCGTDYNALARAVSEGLITEKEVDVALGRVLEARFRLGLFDPPSQVPFSKIGMDQNDSAAHRALSLRTARECVVLLKNDGLLPLKRTQIKRIAVIGTNAASVPMLLGNYNGTPSKPVTLLEGIRSVAGTGIEVVYAPGVALAPRKTGVIKATADTVADAIALAKTADVIIYTGGINSQLEGEEMRRMDYDGFAGGDRTRIELPAVQTEILQDLAALGKPVVFVNCSGSAMAMPWEARHLPAIVQAWYPGEEGGRAVAEVLFGDVNPSGRLPITFYQSTDDLPAFDNYAMTNRTYRYFTGKPLYAFGYGLSYTHFKYKSAKLDHATTAADGTVRVNVQVANTGRQAGDEVVQVYFQHGKSPVAQAREALCGFRRVNIAPGQTASVDIDIPIKQFRYWDTATKKYVVDPGQYTLLIGSASDDLRARVPVKVE